jgi:Domain of unknown function (DUF4360)
MTIVRTIGTKLGNALMALSVPVMVAACEDSSHHDEPAPEPPAAEITVHKSPAKAPLPLAPTATNDKPVPFVPGSELDGVPNGRVPGPDATAGVPGSSGEDIDVTHVSANGTGCPAWTWVGTPSSSDTITLQFDGYMAQVDGADATLAVRDCLIGVKLGVGAERSYSVKSVTYSGHAKLGELATAELSTDYAFQGDPAVHTGSKRSFSGVMEGDYEFVDTVDPAHTVWSPCGLERDLNLRTRLQLRSGAGAAASSVSLASVKSLELGVRDCDDVSGATGAATPATDGPGVVSVTRR